LIVAAPIAVRIWRIVLCTASRKARLAILHQMPTIGDLNRVGKCTGNSFTLSAATVASDDGNLLMALKPSCGCRGLAASSSVTSRLIVIQTTVPIMYSTRSLPNWATGLVGQTPIDEAA
jgi:hypothetical protein